MKAYREGVRSWSPPQQWMVTVEFRPYELRAAGWRARPARRARITLLADAQASVQELAAAADIHLHRAFDDVRGLRVLDAAPAENSRVVKWLLEHGNVMTAFPA